MNTTISTLGTQATRAAALAANPTPPVSAGAPLGSAGQAFSDDPFARMLEQNRQAARLQARREADRERPAQREASPDPVRAPEPAPATAQRPATQPVQPADGPAKTAEAAKPARERGSRPAGPRNGSPAADTQPHPTRAATKHSGTPQAAPGEAGDTPEGGAPSRGRQALAAAAEAAETDLASRPDTRKAAAEIMERRRPGAALAPPAGGPVAGPGVGSPSATGAMPQGGPGAGGPAAAADSSPQDAVSATDAGASAPGASLPLPPVPATVPAPAQTGSPAASDAQRPTLADLQTQAHLPAHPTSSAFGAQLGAQVSLWLKGGVQQAQLHLNPAELGPVRVSIQLDGQAAHVSFSAEQAPTRQALEQALPTLAGTLADAGFTLAGGGVFDQPAGQQPGQPQRDGDSRIGQAGAPVHEARTTAPSPVRPRGMVDLLA